MGHQRLGKLPRTRAWTQVVELIHYGADAAQIANKTIRAAEHELMVASNDPGFSQAFWLLTQIPIAARDQDFSASLARAGIAVRPGPTVLEVATGFGECVDKQSRTTDLGEMARLAATETIVEHMGDKTRGLFGATAEEVQRAFSGMGTVRGFSEFQRAYFARLTQRVLHYYLSRELTKHVGQSSRFPTTAQLAEFESAMNQHCFEASRVIEQFSGEWFSKAKWTEQGQVSKSTASNFTHVAMKKICAELKAGARSDEA